VECMIYRKGYASEALCRHELWKFHSLGFQTMSDSINGVLRGVPNFNFKTTSLFFAEASVEQFICTRVYKRHVT